MNIFEQFNIEMPTLDTVNTDKKSKKGTKKDKESQKKNTKSKVIVKLPTTAHIPLAGDIDLLPENFNSSTEVNSEQTLEFLRDNIGVAIGKNDRISIDKDHKVYIIHASVKNDSLKITSQSKLVYGCESIPLNDVLDNNDVIDISSTDLSNYAKSYLDVLYDFDTYVDGDKIFLEPKPCMNGLERLSKKPFHIVIPGKNSIAVDAMNDVTKEKIIELIVSQNPEMKNKVTLFGLNVTGDENSINAMLNTKNVENKKPTGKKEKLYKISGMILSIIYTSYTLSPSDFNNADSVTKKQLCKFLTNKGHIEFRLDTNVAITEDSESNLLIAHITGSRKGADYNYPNLSITALQNKGLGNGKYFLTTGYINNMLYRIEQFEYGFYMMNIDNPKYSMFKLILPKIPAHILVQAYSLFLTVSRLYNSECILYLFYNRELNQYFLSCPSQRISRTNVTSNRNLDMEKKYLYMGSIHSHGRLDAFFSRTDDRDDIIGIHGVFGGFDDYDKMREKFIFRYACGSITNQVKIEEVFEDLSSILDSYGRIKQFDELFVQKMLATGKIKPDKEENWN